MSEDGKRKPRRQFTEEFKREAVALYERIGGSKAAAELDLNAAQIRQWRKKFKPDQTAPQAGQKTYAELEKENRRLSKENGYLKEINKVLKKSTAIFSQDHMGGSK